MKLIAIILLFVTVTAIANDPSPRFERILDEHHDTHTNHVAVFEVWHDRVSGQEFTCAQSYDTNSTGGLDGKSFPVSCFPTGRKW